MDAKYKAYLKSDEWAQLKIDLFDLRGRSCEQCSRTSNLAVHHLTYDNIFNEEPEDLIILCGLCHAKAHGKIKPKKKRKKKKKYKPKPKVKTKVKRAKKPKKKGSISFIKDGNTTMIVTRRPVVSDN